MAPLEASWWVEGPTRWAGSHKPDWHWRARIRVPDFVDEAMVSKAKSELTSQGKTGRFDDISLTSIDDGDCVRVLHVGPYAHEAPTIQSMEVFAEESGYTLRDHHHEVYLSDPRRTKPHRLRKVLRHPVTNRSSV